MTDEDFKTLADRNRNNTFDLCFEYYVDEAKSKGYKIYPQDMFEQQFPIFLMMSGDFDVVNGINNTVERLKKKHNYGT